MRVSATRLGSQSAAVIIAVSVANSQEQINRFLSDENAEQINRQPIIESSVRKSKNGQWVIHKTVITDIKPVSYFQKVMEGQATAKA